MKKLKREIIYFQWEDACIHGTHTQNFDEEKYNLIKIASCGILVRENKDSITICQDLNYEFNDGRSTATYPKSCIKDIKRVKI